MMSRVRRAALRYYAALRISAAAATLTLPDEPRADKPPVVRHWQARLIGGFDQRETIERYGKSYVVTLPGDDARPGSSSAFLLN